MLAMIGFFNLLASLGTLIPAFVKDRVNEQFIPIWEHFLAPFTGGQPSESALRAMAVLSQWVIGLWELAAGTILMLAIIKPSRRMRLSHLGLSMVFALYSVFMFTLFGTHDKRLHHWDQYPPLLAWVAVTWIVVYLTEREKPDAQAED
jgi:uncharacterized membrane protein